MPFPPAVSPTKIYFYIESLGCVKNQVDTENLISILEYHGLSYTENPDSAAFIVVNTCGFIESAKQESIEAALELKARYPEKKVVMTGCLALRYEDELKNELPEIDGIWGNGFDSGFQGFIHKFIPTQAPQIIGKVRLQSPFTSERTRLLSFPGSAYVKIAEGCSNRCTYCAIPIIRGKLESRKRREILSEVKGLLKRGIREVILVAQDTASFGTDRGKKELAPLLREIGLLDGDFWIRLLYVHPDHLDDALIETVRSSPKIIPYFDIPFQHANERILKTMNRKGSHGSYQGAIERLRKAIPEAVIRTTFLVGFPGETDEDFSELLAFQEEIRPQWAGMFAYSREEGTPAFMFRKRVSRKTALARKKILEEKQLRITEDWLDTLIGFECDVLIEEEVQGESLALGRAYFQAPEVDGLLVVKGDCRTPGTMLRVKITGRSGVDLEAVQVHA